MLLFGLGLSFTVAPLTSTVLASAPDHQAGIASAINNDVARVAGLLAVAVLPALAGITPAAYADPALLSAGFHRAALIAGIPLRGRRCAGASRRFGTRCPGPRPTTPRPPNGRTGRWNAGRPGLRPHIGGPRGWAAPRVRCWLRTSRPR